MKSLHKTFDILEYVVLQNGERVTPTQVAEALSINLATCTRIMGELVKRGYLVQISRKEGYMPGPMITALGTRHNCYERLASAARRPIEKLSEQFGCQVNLAVMHAGRRIMLCYHLNPAGMSPWKQFSFSDHWETATGRLLIASLDVPEARKLTSVVGIHPFPRSELERIRQRGYVHLQQNRLTVIGRLIPLSGYPPAAFGFGVPPERADEALKVSDKAAAAIAEILNPPHQAY